MAYVSNYIAMETDLHILAGKVLNRTIKTDNCWYYCGGNSRGYGHVYSEYNRKTYKVHRVMYEYYNVYISPNKDVRHLCNNKICVNPAHLKSGTRQENINDQILHGTRRNGEKHHNVKLTEKEVIEIRRKIKEKNITQQSLAFEYQVDQTTISDIKNQRSWKHLRGD